MKHRQMLSISSELKFKVHLSSPEHLSRENSRHENEGKDDHDDEPPKMAISELLVLAKKMEAGYVSQVGADSLPDFLHHLHAFQAELHRDQMKNAKQVTMDGFFKQA